MVNCYGGAHFARLLSASEGGMICKECADAADQNAEIQKAVASGKGIQLHWVAHPENCKCPCMHKAPGSWKGRK